MAAYSPGNLGMDISSSWEGLPCFTYVYQVPSSSSTLLSPVSCDGQLASPNYSTDNAIMECPPLQYSFIPSEPAVNQICDGNPCRCYSYLSQPNYNNNTGSTVVVGDSGITWETQQQQQQLPMATTGTMMMMSPYQMIPNANSECSESISTPSLCSPSLSDSQGSDSIMSPPPTPTTSTTSLFIEIPPYQNNFVPVAVPSHPYYYYQNGMEISPQPPFQLLSMPPPQLPTTTNDASQFDPYTLQNKNEKKPLKSFRNKQPQQVVSSMGSCEFCRSNGESVKIYRGHSLKDLNGNVTCPILFKYTCPHCNATGARAHTLKYCPLMKGKTEFQYKKVRNSIGRLTTLKY